MSGRRLAPLCSLLLFAGCTSSALVRGDLSPAPVPGAGFRAGAARVDITPPPGPGLFGYGPEGQRAEGFRQRLWSRALVLEDERGERYAFVSAELGAVSLLLHRRVAERLQEADAARAVPLRLGVDRLFIAATHTHAGPGNLLGASYDVFGSRVPGHDAALLDYVVERIARSVERAFEDLGPAVAGWGTAHVWGLTRNRALDAFLANEPAWRPPAAPPANDTLAAVDPSWHMLRVDRLASDGRRRPLAALSIFAVHGTAVPAANRLFDSDIHGYVSARIERRLAADGPLDATEPRFVHLFVNGAAGDVSPVQSPRTRCAIPRKQSFVPSIVALLLPVDFIWERPPAAEQRACVRRAVHAMIQVGDSMAAAALRLHRSLGPELTEPTILRAFRVATLAGRRQDVAGLCREAQVGIAAPSGVADGKTRYDGLLGIEEGHRAFSRACQSPKIAFLGFGQDFLLRRQALPLVGQFAVVRIGSMTLGAVPAEVTTSAGARMRAAIAREAERRGFEGDVALVTLANGYVQYVTTPEEYAFQNYEGASTLYGPGEADAFARILAESTRRLGTEHAAPASIRPEEITLLPLDDIVEWGPDRAHPATPLRAEARCAAGSALSVRWVDLPARAMFARPGAWFEIVDADSGERVAWDGHPLVEVRSGAHTAAGPTWELRWLEPPPGSYLVRLRQGAVLRVDCA